MEVHPDSWIVAICTSQNWSSSFSQCQIDYCHILLACEIRVSAKTCHMQTLPFLWIALKNVKFFPLILWLSMPIDEGAQPFWEGEASLGISEIGAFLHFHAFHSRKCLLHNEFQRAAISYLRSPEMEANRTNRHANGMSGWWGTSGQVDKWTSEQQPLNEKQGHYHHWPRHTALCLLHYSDNGTLGANSWTSH